MEIFVRGVALMAGVIFSVFTTAAFAANDGQPGSSAAAKRAPTSGEIAELWLQQLSRWDAEQGAVERFSGGFRGVDRYTGRIHVMQLTVDQLSCQRLTPVKFKCRHMNHDTQMEGPKGKLKTVKESYEVNQVYEWTGKGLYLKWLDETIAAGIPKLRGAVAQDKENWESSQRDAYRQRERQQDEQREKQRQDEDFNRAIIDSMN